MIFCFVEPCSVHARCICVLLFLAEFLSLLFCWFCAGFVHFVVCFSLSCCVFICCLHISCQNFLMVLMDSDGQRRAFYGHDVVCFIVYFPCLQLTCFFDLQFSPTFLSLVFSINTHTHTHPHTWTPTCTHAAVQSSKHHLIPPSTHTHTRLLWFFCLSTLLVFVFLLVSFSVFLSFIFIQ